MLSSKTKIAACLLTMFFLAGPVRAADDLAGVYDRARYAYARTGRQFGSFIYTPVIALQEAYDNNIYKKPGGKQADLISVITPGISLNSDLDMYTFGLRANGNFGFYRDHKDENFRDYNLLARGGWSMAYATALSGALSEEKSHDDRSSPDDPGADRPVQFHLSTQALNFTRALGIVKLYIDAVREHLTFSDSKKGAVTIDNSVRDRDIYALTGKLAYEFLPGYQLFTSLKSDTRQYLKKRALDRDSVGYDLKLGTDLFVTDKVKGTLFVGNLRRSYSSLPDVNTVDYGGALLWNVTPLTSITATLERTFDETTFRDTSGALSTNASVSVEHGLRPNLFLLGTAGVSYGDFKANSNFVRRQDTNYSSGVSLEYLPTDHVSANLGYQYRQRQSTLSSADFSDNVVKLTVAFGF